MEEEGTRIALGADPEFEFIYEGRIFIASYFLGAEVHLPWGIIARDKSGNPIELRPQPSPHPETLVRNVGHSAPVMLLRFGVRSGVRKALEAVGFGRKEGEAKVGWRSGGGLGLGRKEEKW